MQNIDNDYYDSLIKCGERYQVMVERYWDDCVYWGFGKFPNNTQVDELRNFVRLFRDNCKDKQPLMKLNRWLGYIQGTVIAWGLTTVEKERDWTRPLFRPLDFPPRVDYDEASGRFDNVDQKV